MQELTTTIHAYAYDVRDPAHKATYEEVKKMLKRQGLKCFISWGGASHYRTDLDGVTLTLETKHLFRDQWNTAPLPGTDNGLRVFDWAQDYMEHGQSHIKRGHYLMQTAEMVKVRRDTLKCGYCGAYEPAAKGLTFCPHCLDSQYLKAGDLFLTRLLPVCDVDNRAPLTEEESAQLMPLFLAAQTHGSTERGRARLADDRRKIQAKYEESIRNATIERDGMVWLMDHGISLENVIYYGHKGEFCFGWRKPLSPDELSHLRGQLGAEYPFEYDVKTES